VKGHSAEMSSIHVSFGVDRGHGLLAGWKMGWNGGREGPRGDIEGNEVELGPASAMIVIDILRGDQGKKIPLLNLKDH